MTTGPTIINNRSTLATDPVRNFRFLVTFQPHDKTNPAFGAATTTLGFTSVSGMAVTTDSIPYREGGYNTTVHQIPGQTTFAPITLQRGVILGTKQNWEWMRNLFATVQGGGTTRSLATNFRCDLEIQVLAHPIPKAGEGAGGAAGATTDYTAMRFKVYNCWPTSVAYSDLNAGDNALFVEQMTLVHEGFDLNWSGNTLVSDEASKDFPEKTSSAATAAAATAAAATK
jgi:phage tail-like protein